MTVCTSPNTLPREDSLRVSGSNMNEVNMEPRTSLTRRSTPRRMSSTPSTTTASTPDHRYCKHRSSSRSTGHSSLPSHSRVPTTASLTPFTHSRSRPDQNRETLLALHRDSCRLFQQDHGTHTTTTTPATTRPTSMMTKATIHTTASTASSEIGSPPLSPALYARSSTSNRSLDHVHMEDGGPAPLYPVQHPAGPSKQPPQTVIDWTSPSTRRREYAKIDRASHGVRGLWRRVAPRWCQFGNDRVPFFDPGKSGKAGYEGSVRRFRMDLPDEQQTEVTNSLPRRGIGRKLKSRRHTAT